jgi:hypothetical protein
VVHPVLRALHQVARTPLLIRPELRKVLGRRTTFPRAMGDGKTGLFVVSYRPSSSSGCCLAVALVESVQLEQNPEPDATAEGEAWWGARG